MWSITLLSSTYAQQNVPQVIYICHDAFQIGDDEILSQTIIVAVGLDTLLMTELLKIL